METTGRKISFSMARLDEVAFATSPCLWPKALQDVILALRCFPPGLHHSLPTKNKNWKGDKLREKKNKWILALSSRSHNKTRCLRQSSLQFLCASRWWPCRVALCTSAVPTALPIAVLTAQMGSGCVRSGLLGVTLFVTGTIRNSGSGQRLSTAEDPRCRPGSPPSP